MDVRCEKCHTEYELEESKVTEAGVTVKCTSCGNLFKIKRRSAAPPPRPPDVPPDAGVMWVIRSPGGEHRRFRELTTLQQWIVERKVTRECEISRSGDSWKRLGDIAELSAFFAIVDQAQGTARPPVAAVDRKATQPMAPSTVAPARPPPMPSATLPLMPTPPAAAPEPQMLAHEPDLEPALMSDKPLELAQTAHLPRVRGDGGERERPMPRSSWAGAAVAAPAADLDDPPAGDSETPEGEPAWAKGKAVALKASRSDAPTFELPGLPIDDPNRGGGFGNDNDYDSFRPRRQSRAWLWISGAVIASGLGIGYLLMRNPNPQPTAEAPAPSPVVQPGPAAPAAAPDAAAAAVDPAAQAYRDALAKLAEDTDEGFAAAEKLLEGARVADAEKDARAAAALALVNASVAQYLLDDAALAGDPRVAEQARAESARRLARADKLAREAESKAPQSPEALISSAEVLRLSKKSAAEIDKKLAGAGENAEALYVRGMTRWRDGKTAEAEDLLNQAVAARAKEGGQHLRALYRLAAIAVAAKKTDEAKNHLEAILAAQPAHARARALAGKLTAAPPPVAAAPTPAAPTPAAPPAATERPRPAEDLGTGPISASAYGGLVQKGDKLAENGDCTGAQKYYERALDARPGGVEALTGLGYCHLDRKEYVRAISSFRAALGISGRYTEALIGIAEAYRFQGQTQEAVTYYKRYLEQAPNGPKAALARRYVDEATTASAPAPAPTTPAPAPTETRPAEPAAPPPIDRLPDKPGEPAAPPPATEPAPAPSENQKLPDKPAEPAEQPKTEPAPEPPPPQRTGDPAAPDSPRQ